MKKQIIVDFAEDGSVKIDSVGFKGMECEKATSFLEKLLGVVKDNKRKPEYRQTDERQELKQ